MSKLVELERAVQSSVKVVADFQVNGTAAATATNYPKAFFIADQPYRIDKILVKWGTASTSGTLTFKKSASAVDTGASGTAITGAVDMSATANVHTTVSLLTTAGLNVLNTGDALGVAAAGTLTSQADVCAIVYLVPLTVETLAI